VVTRQLQVERRTGKVRQLKTDVIPLCYATNQAVVIVVVVVLVLVAAAGVVSARGKIK